MKKCKCVSDVFFKQFPEGEYNIKIGDVYYYQNGDIISVDDCLHTLIEIYDDKGKSVAFMIDFHFQKCFKELSVFRKDTIDDLLKDNDNDS